jgi:hypothetical protein
MKVVRLLDILVLVFLPMVIDYSNSGVREHSLGVATQINIIEELWLVFVGLWFTFL